MLLTTDFNTHIYPEIVAAIDRDDEGLLQKAIDYAEALAKGYLNRYNISVLFGAQGSNRDDYLLGLLKDIATHQFAKLSNVQQDMGLIIDNYDKAMAELVKIQKGLVTPFNWPANVNTDGTTDTYFNVSSAPKRETRY